jgi:hypothetical protein
MKALLALTVASLLVALPLTSHATVVYVSDSFDDGGISNGADPQDVAWTKMNGDNAVVGYSANQLVFDNGRSYNNGAYPNARGGLFAGPTLAIGGKVQLSFRFKVTLAAPYPNPSNQLTWNGAAFRFGLGNSSLTYSRNFGSGDSAGGSITRYDANGTYDGAAALTTSVTPFAIHDNNWHTYVLTLERTGTSTVSIVGTVDGNTAQGTHASATNFTFDRIILGQGNVCNLDMLFDDFLVTDGVPPAPAGSTIVLR